MPNEPASVHDEFTQMYAGNPPWEIGRPQSPFIEAAGQIISPVLDAGCGTGNVSLYFAALGHQVTGIDFVEEAILRARAKAAARGLPVQFEIKDAMTLGEWDQRFASVIDSGLFHIYHGREREQYAQGLAHILNPGGRLFLFGFSDQEPPRPGRPVGLSRRELSDAFSDGWTIESLNLVRGELNPAFLAESPQSAGDGGPLMWFAVIRRAAPGVEL
ncbi:class I SAM-dependent methyltransferase [Paludibaculum fermentans]|uniref:Methyltransferase domain-containing protein n=1 Tax=Paludibaculum fermentans TaxID=1473598 RepID=A0A7S7NW88_PALFE|nr:class I SAM-dependent methyltransferase [Paludibaculum fermentans]QOY90928.1 methyltransferase domain-containing protein [Paludibaculum fermentans]